MADPAKPGPILSAAEVNSTAWDKIKQHYTARLAMLRMQNDNDLSHEDTQFLRGRIREVKVILKLDEEMPKIEFKATEPK